uniref:Coatomer subunit zeta n=1 Tax=Macrostomum lignano TaxID=282301 RepID=A0A1I8HNM3_9PLAT
ELPIRRSRVLNSWQSSFAATQTCFYDKQKYDELYLDTKLMAETFFKSSQITDEVNDGFHWFAVQLNETVLIRSVTVTGRADVLRASLQLQEHKQAVQSNTAALETVRCHRQ